MRIVFITPRFFPHRGGVETHCLAIAKELMRFGHQVHVITQAQLDDEPEQSTFEGIRITRLPAEKSLLNGWQKKILVWNWWWQQRNLVNKRATDVVHVHDVGWWILPLRLMGKMSFYITFHGWETKWPISWKAKLQRLVLSTLAVGRVHVGAWIQEFYWDKPTIVTYGGVTLDRVVHSTRTPWSLKQPLQVVFVGRLAEDIGVVEYLKLARLWKKNQLPFSITWVGDGELATECAQLGTVTGWVDKPELYLAKADVVWASSYLSILSAQASGVIVMSVAQQDLKKRYLQTYPGYNWLLVGATADELNTLFVRFKTDSFKWRKQVTGARQFAEKQTWNEVAKSYLSLWKKKQG